MKYLVICLLLLRALFSVSQTLTDVALTQGVTLNQQAEAHNGNGMSFYDFDNDGWDDLTFPTQNDSISFYRNVNGSFINTGSYLYAPGSVRQVLWADLSNDGIIDLCVSYADLGVRIYENDGNFNFTDITSGSGILTINDSYGISCADPDLDGDLDLYVSYYTFQTSNLYYENQGDGTFIESGGSNNIHNELNPTFMASWFDYNNDDLIDLHVINDKNASNDALYRNLGLNQFTDEAVALGVSNNGHYPMTSSISDFNNDGFQDIFVTDISDGSIVFGVQVGNKLFKNQAGSSFVNVAPQMNLDTNIMAWGALWVDYDNDCYEDLFVATSFINTNVHPDATSLMFKNNGGNSFTKILDSINGDITNSAYCPVKGDINNDGFYDIVVLTDSVDPNVLLNSGNNGNGYIKITPVGIVSNKQAIGTKIKVYAAGETQYQTVFCGTGLCAQYSQHMIFGVKNAAVVDSIEVIFPSGIVVKKYNLAINQDYTILEQVFEQVELASGADTVYLCQGDSIIIGVEGYSNYSWNNGSTDSLIVVSSPGVYQFQASTVILDTIFESNELTVIWDNFPGLQEVITNPSCGTENLGEVSILLINSNDSISTIIWNTGDQEFWLDSLAEGTYSYEIITANNCLVNGSVILTETAPFDVQFITTPATDTDGGSIQFFEFGGVPGFTYVLNGQLESNFIDSLSAGTYEITIEDAIGCQVTVIFTINDESVADIFENTQLSKVFYNNGTMVLCLNEDLDQVEIYDMNGKIVQIEDEWIEQADGCIVNHCNLKQGLYQVYIKTKKSQFSETVFIP